MACQNSYNPQSSNRVATLKLISHFNFDLFIYWAHGIFIISCTYTHERLGDIQDTIVNTLADTVNTLAE